MNSNKVSGKIILKETGFGIPDLLIVIYDLDPNARPEEVFATTGVNLPAGVLAADRLGSALTDKNGVFELTYEDEEFRAANPDEKRPDLSLMVLAPEEPSADQRPRILYISAAVRQNAGRAEQYVIRLTTEQLEKAGARALLHSRRDDLKE